MAACPHANIVFCPLYHAAHGEDGGGCDDGQLHSMECAVARGLVYGDAVAKLDQRKVAILKFREAAEASKQQRIANMRVNGIH